jgi:hypothetical protein
MTCSRADSTFSMWCHCIMTTIIDRNGQNEDIIFILEWSYIMLLYFNSTCWITLPEHYLRPMHWYMYDNYCQYKHRYQMRKTCLWQKKKNKEKFEDTKGVIRIHKSKGRQFNGHMKIESKTIIGPHSTTHKHIDWST